MKRRQLLGLFGAAGAATLCGSSPEAARGEEAEPPKGPPQLSVEELVRRVKEKGFRPDSLYAHELEFRGKVLIKRDVPLLQIVGMTGGFSRVHLYGGGGNVDVGKELIIKGLIVDHGFGALMVWNREWKYADA